jgi:hypothetical protein
LVQISRSLSDFLSSPGIYEYTCPLRVFAEQDTPFPEGNHLAFQGT